MNVELWMDNLFAWSLQVAVLISASAVLLFFLKLRNPRVLLACWRGLFAICLLLPLIQPWKSLETSSIRPMPSGSIQIETTTAVPATGGFLFPLKHSLAFALTLGIAARIAWLCLGLFRLSRYRQKALPLNPLPPELREMCGRVGVTPQIYLSREMKSPATFGVWNPAILLPEGFLNTLPGFQRAVLCHELWHVRRKDWLLTFAEEIAAALTWFHPAVWWIVGRIQLSREQVVDGLVLKTTQERESYLDALLKVALANRQPAVGLAHPFLTKHHLTQRVALILTEVRMSQTRLITSLAVLLCLLSLAGKLAIQAFPLQSPQSPQPEPSAAQEASNWAGTVSLVIPPEELSQRRVHQVRPSYPPAAKTQRIQGEVLLEVRVNEKGEVDNIGVIKGNALLVLPALDAVKQWKYSPYIKDGVAVPVSSHVVVNFALLDAGTSGQQKAGPSMVRVGGSVMAAQHEHRVEPVYPTEAKEKGVEGEVEFEIIIDEQGEVADVQVLSGNAMLVSAAYEAVRQWRYKPVLLNGVPIRAKTTLKVKFELDRKHGAAEARPLANATLAEHQLPIAYVNTGLGSD